MLQLTDTKVSPRPIAPPRRRSASIAQAHPPASEVHSNAAPLTLAAVVAAGLLLAVTVAIVTALGG